MMFICMMMEQMVNMNAKKAGHSGGSDAYGEGGKRDPGLKTINDMLAVKKQIRKHPNKIIRRFEADCKRELGVVEGQPWTLVDWWRKIA